MSPTELLSALPSHCVRPLAPFTPAEVERWAEQSGQQFVPIDLALAGSKKAALQAIGRALGFPAWYGANLDALYDCLTDLVDTGGAPPRLILISHMAGGSLDEDQQAALLDVFRDALEVFADAGIGLRVLHAP